MAIKKRPPVDQARIEAFGAAAEQPAGSPQPGTSRTSTVKRQPASRTTRKETAGEWPADVPKTFLIRWSDPALATELAEVSALEDRSQHKTALRALQRGLEALRAEHTD